MIPKEKAQELVNKFKDYVHGYIGSSMLTNHEYPEQILSQAKKAATIVVDEILLSFDGFMDARKNFRHELEIDAERYWKSVKTEIESLVV